MSLIASQRLQNGLGCHHCHHQIVYQDDEGLRFNCVAALGEESTGIHKTRDLSGFINERFSATTDFRREMYGIEQSGSSDPERGPRPLHVKDTVELTNVEKKILNRLTETLEHFRLTDNLRVAGGWVRGEVFLSVSSEDK